MPAFDGIAEPATAGVAPPRLRSRPAAATRVLAGAMPTPLLSSRARGWNGLTVELHSFHDLDTVAHSPDHVIAVHLAGNVTVHQECSGRSRSRAMRPGDITITPVGPPVRWRQAGHSLVILIRLSPAYVRAFAGEECALDPDRFEIQRVFSARDAHIEEMGRGLLACLEIDGAHSHLHAEALTCDLAIRLLRMYTTASAVPTWSKAKLSPHKLRQAVQYIDANLRHDLTLGAIAEAVALSPGHFAHAFRAATGVAPHRYIVERRVERAKALLRASELPITEIADRVGCASHSHFSVLFHRVTGLTPRQFRNLV